MRDDEPKDVAVIRDAIAGNVSAASTLTTLKSEALKRETAYITNGRGKTLDIETESFGPGAVADAIDDRAKDGDHVRLIAVKNDVYGKDHHATAKAEIAQLIHDGVEVRMNPAIGAEKMAIFPTGGGWLGSANATAGRAGTIDWGRTLDTPSIITRMHADFERTWNASTPYDAAAADRASPA